MLQSDIWSNTIKNPMDSLKTTAYLLHEYIQTYAWKIRRLIEIIKINSEYKTFFVKLKIITYSKLGLCF